MVSLVNSVAMKREQKNVSVGSAMGNFWAKEDYRSGILNLCCLVDGFEDDSIC